MDQNLFAYDEMFKKAGLSYYILKGQSVVPVLHSEWVLRTYKTSGNNPYIIKKDFANEDQLVSTIFIWMPDVIFETMLFTRGEDGEIYSNGEVIGRPDTYPNAIKLHKLTLLKLKSQQVNTAAK